VLKLRTLGGLYVSDDAGEPLGGAATQRRTLALLAALAVAGDRGLSRDKLVALLWPEVDEDRGRHSLTQALYAARRALDVDDLFLVGGEIRLRRDRCASDVQELEEALDAGDLARAAALYSGPFADGFYLPGSGEFEYWTSEQRARLEDRMAGALDRLATQEEAAGREKEALACRKRLAAIRPLDAAVAVALMRTLAHAGDRAGALQHAQLHQTLLREQLGLDPDPVVTSLAARLRQPLEWGAGRPEPAAAVALASEGEVHAEPQTEEPAEEIVPPGGPDPRTAAPRARRLALWWGVATIITGIAAALILTVRGAADRATTPAVPRIAQKVVVAPFRVSGASASLAYLREGMVELLSTRLADDSSARSVDAGAVLAAWRAAGLGESSSVPRATMVGLAEDLGAERLVIGSVVGTQSRVVVTAGVIEVASGRGLGEATVEGPADSITSVVDRLAARLLVLDAGEDAALSTRTTQSLAALRTFLEGQSEFRRGNYTLASRQYAEAVRLDSTFALAALQLARSADRLQLVEPRTRALALAWREQAALDARARALLVAFAGPAYPAPSEASEQVDAWERLVDLTPDRADAWYELGARLSAEGSVAGEPEAGPRAAAALRRALQLDSTHGPSLELMAWTTPEPLSRRDETGLPLSPYLHWRSAVRRGDTAALRVRRETLARLGPRNLRAIAQTAQLDASALDDARLALDQLRARAVRPEDRLDAALADHALALNEGRLRDAGAAIERLAQLRPGAQPQLRLRILDALYGDGDARAAESAARVLRRSVGTQDVADPAVRAIQLANACVLGQWLLQRGDTTGVPHLIQRLRQAPLSAVSLAPPVASAPRACARLLEVDLAVTLGRPGATEAMARVDSLALTVGTAGDAVAYAPILLGRLHERLGQPQAALDAVRRREDLVGWPRYRAAAWRDEGRYAAAASQPEAARLAFGKYLALRRGADPELSDAVERVRRDSAALGPATR
jgi:DNA-binding SARP family transcriptional activator/TolB-like protein